MGRLRVYKRGKTWCYGFEMASVGGVRKMLRKGSFRLRSEAEAAGYRAKREYENGGSAFRAEDISLADYLDQWMRDGQYHDYDIIMRKLDGSYLQSRTQQHTNHVIHTELGIKSYDYHSLRHTHATIFMEHGVPIKAVQERLGHKTSRSR